MVTNPPTQAVLAIRTSSGVWRVAHSGPMDPTQVHACLSSPAGLKTRVCIWTITVSASIPEVLLGELDGLVIAGAGVAGPPVALVGAGVGAAIGPAVRKDR
jgi:hypothetical protein